MPVTDVQRLTDVQQLTDVQRHQAHRAGLPVMLADTRALLQMSLASAAELRKPRGARSR